MLLDLQWYWWCLIVFIIVEVVSWFGRCVLKKTGTQVRPYILYREWKIGWHHGATGAVLMAIYGLSELPSEVHFYLFWVLGLALFLNDFFHHALLKLVYGQWDPSEPP